MTRRSSRQVFKEFDGDKLVKTFTYDYDEKYAVKTNKVETDGQTYDEATRSLITPIEDNKNKYDEIKESVDIMGNKTQYERDDNGNVTKTINPDGTFTMARYNDKKICLLFRLTRAIMLLSMSMIIRA